MKALILSSSREEIDSYYKSIARSISNYLAINGFDLVFGGCSSSMMGICYDEFTSQEKNVYSFTTEKYINDTINLPKATHYICNTTFDLKRAMFEFSDVIIALPGGVGTLSELLSYIEENRSNDKNKPIIIYDENKYYQFLFNQLNIMKENNFMTSDISEYVTITHNKDEFTTSIERIIYKEGIKKYEK